MIAVTAPKPGACGTWYPSQAPTAAQAMAVNAPTPRGAVDRNQPVCTARATGGAIETTASVASVIGTVGSATRAISTPRHQPPKPSSSANSDRTATLVFRPNVAPRRSRRANQRTERTRRAAKPRKTLTTISAILPWVFDGVKSSWLVV